MKPQFIIEAMLANLTYVPPPFPLLEPLTHVTLTVIPDLPDISEGDHLYLICGTKGTPPITFKWYRVGTEQPLEATTSYRNNTDYQIPFLSKDHSGRYYCEAVNHANNVVRSDRVSIEGETDGSVGTPPSLDLLFCDLTLTSDFFISGAFCMYTKEKLKNPERDNGIIMVSSD